MRLVHLIGLGRCSLRGLRSNLVLSQSGFLWKEPLRRGFKCKWSGQRREHWEGTGALTQGSEGRLYRCITKQSTPQATSSYPTRDCYTFLRYVAQERCSMVVGCSWGPWIPLLFWSDVRVGKAGSRIKKKIHRPRKVGFHGRMLDWCPLKRHREAM